MANEFSVTSFTSRVLGTFLTQQSPFMGLSYRGVPEFEESGRMYASADTVNIKIPGYPTIQRGLTTTAESITDRVVPYVISDTDIYSTSFDLNIRESVMKIVGGIKLVFTSDPNKDGNGGKGMNPQAKAYIDNYVTPSGETILGSLEVELATKCKNAAFYTPVTSNSSLQAVNSYSKISAVNSLMNQLGMMKTQRYGIMNNNDANSVADSLQNMFNTAINDNITKNARLGGPDKGRLANFDIYESNSIPVQESSLQYLANPNSTGVTVDSVASDGSTITFAGIEASTVGVINAGTMISIPTVFLINKVNKLPLATNLVVVAAADADSDAGGLCTVTLSEPLVVTGFHKNVDSLPSNGDAVEVIAGHRNNFFFVPMGIIANPIALQEIFGADNSRYNLRGANVDCRTYIQGVVNNGVNSIRMSTLVPTLGIPSYLINLPSPL